MRITPAQSDPPPTLPAIAFADDPAAAAAALPILVVEAGDDAARRFVEFFTVTLRNRHTRRAYARACWDFLGFMDDRARGVELPFVQPTHVAAWVEHMTLDRDAGGLGLSPPTVKQRLAAVRMLFDWLVVGHVLRDNPAAAVKGPRHVVKVGKTPVLDASQCRELLDSIKVNTPVGLRDRALIGAMVYSFARVGAVVRMDVRDYWQNGKRWWLRLHEKGGKHHEVPAHHKAEAHLDAYLSALNGDPDLDAGPRTPLFRTVSKGCLTARRLRADDVLKMVKRRGRRLGLPPGICCHTFRATGITAYLGNGGTLEHAQRIACHESPRTTKLYDRTKDEITLEEIERIAV